MICKKICRLVILSVVTLCVTMLCANRASAQYYDWGQDPASIKWMQIKSKDGRFIFPDYYTQKAVQLMHYMERVEPEISYGFKHRPIRMPVFMHTQNFSPNGLVMLAPNRMELITTPSTTIAAMPWLKQLAVHEYRHNVQFANMNQNVIKVLSYILGQHGSLIGAAFFPYWAMEGDAVLAETQFSSFGRALQPSFTIGYRALALEGATVGESREMGRRGRVRGENKGNSGVGGDSEDGAEYKEDGEGKGYGGERTHRGSKTNSARDNGYPIDKYFAGSFRHYLPDHYQLGYQLTSWAYTQHGSDYWSRVVDYGTRRPYQLFTAKVAQRKYFGSSTNKLFYGAFEDLANFWRSQPLVDNSSKIIQTPTTSYTTYSSPISLDANTVVALKSDFDRTSRIVMVEVESGQESVLHRTGVVNSPLTYFDGTLWWSELRQSTFWEQRVNSQICWYDIAESRAGVERSEKRAMFPVGMPNGYALVEYDYDGTYSIIRKDSQTITAWRLELPDSVSLHGLAWDDVMQTLYFIALSDAGMWIGSAKEGDSSFEQVTAPNYATISDLRAGKGSLYFTSIASGKDEAHMYSLSGSGECVLSRSRYGSFSPSPEAEGEAVVVTTYTPNGYMLAIQPFDSTVMERVVRSNLPRNTVNPERVKWDVTNIDSLVVPSTTDRKIERYRKGLNLFQFHSWAPLHYEPDQIISESRFNINVGVTLLSQNILNNTFTTLGYKYTEAGHFGTASVRYYGLAPKFEVEAEYGSARQLFYRPVLDEDTPKVNPHFSNMFNITARAFLPITLSSGYHLRWLTPMVEFQHENAKIHAPRVAADSQVAPRYRNGVQKLILSLQYSEQVRMAYRDFLPRFGYIFRVRHTSNPWDRSFSSIWSVYGRMYLQGVAKHHSLMLRGAAQKNRSKYYNFRQKELFPRGANYNITPMHYWSFSGDYQLPVWYPDGGISSVIYFKRIRANVFGDFARYRKTGNKGWQNITSYGLDITLDIVPLRLPSNTNTSITISIQKPSTHRGVVVSFGFGMPI